jgi:hypothetical protein
MHWQVYQCRAVQGYIKASSYTSNDEYGRYNVFYGVYFTDHILWRSIKPLYILYNV